MSSIQEAARKLAKKARSKKGYTDEDVQAVVAAVRACDEENKELCDKYRAAAQELTANQEGQLEVDDGAIVSLSSDGGAYVQAWFWVDESYFDEED